MCNDSLAVPFGTPLNEKTGDVVDRGICEHHLKLAVKLAGDAGSVDCINATTGALKIYFLSTITSRYPRGSAWMRPKALPIERQQGTRGLRRGTTWMAGRRAFGRTPVLRRAMPGHDGERGNFSKHRDPDAHDRLPCSRRS